MNSVSNPPVASFFSSSPSSSNSSSSNSTSASPVANTVVSLPPTPSPSAPSAPSAPSNPSTPSPKKRKRSNASDDSESPPTDDSSRLKWHWPDIELFVEKVFKYKGLGQAMMTKVHSELTVNVLNESHRTFFDGISIAQLERKWKGTPSITSLIHLIYLTCSFPFG